ncbi:hypothetical protein F4775DRAFT_591984 [Biscogniauxia sp. FL1348]|nr:hypothetical protein F4775DRAFT_591984 [Biscogniauxia sp. FL1348]
MEAKSQLTPHNSDRRARVRGVSRITIQIRLWASNRPCSVSVDENFASYLNNNRGSLGNLWGFTPSPYSDSPVAHPDIFLIQVVARLHSRPGWTRQLSQYVEDLKAHVQTQIVPSYSERYNITPIFLSFVPLSGGDDIPSSGLFIHMEAPEDLESEIRRGKSTITEIITDAILPVEPVSMVVHALHCWIGGGKRPDSDNSSHQAPLPKDTIQSIGSSMLSFVEGLPLIRDKVRRIENISQGKKEASADVERLKKASNASKRVLQKWSNMTSDEDSVLLSKTGDSLELIQQTMEVVKERRALEATMNQVLPLWDERYSYKKNWAGIASLLTTIPTLCTPVIGAPWLVATSASIAWRIYYNWGKVPMGKSVRDTQNDSKSSGEQLRGMLALHFLHQAGLTTRLGAEDKQRIFENLQIQPDMIEDGGYKAGFIKTAMEEFLHFNQMYIEAVEKLLASC